MAQCSASNRQQVVMLLLMTCFALALTAPTTSSFAATSETLAKPSSTEVVGTKSVDDIEETSTTMKTSAVPIIATSSQKPSEIVNRLKENNDLLLPVSMTTTSRADLDTVTSSSEDDNEMMKTRLGVTATTKSESLIVGKSTTKGSAIEIVTTEYDNGSIKIHEHEAASQMPSTMTNDFPSPTTVSIETNANKSIKSDVRATRSDANVDVTTTAAVHSVATTIEMPIKLDADNLKVMEDERDFPTSTMETPQQNVETKKGKLRESKKKAWTAGMEKKQKLKQKFYSEINHHAIVPTNEATQLATDKPSELYETTQAATISTSIKTAPTTIKSTTLTTIKSSDLESETTQPTFTKEKSSTEAALNANEMEELEVSTGASVTANEKHTHGDNVFVLNTNSSGLIVVDIMEGFGTENASNNTETFEIKMDLIDDSITAETTTEESRREGDRARVVDEMQKLLETSKKDDIFLTTLETAAATSSSSADENKLTIIDSVTTTNDDIILINENNDSTTTQSTTRIKWNQVSDGNIKITFDNIALPNQKVNVSIENGELVIDSIDIAVLNKAEEEMKKRQQEFNATTREDGKLNKTDSLEIILIEDDSHQDEKDTNRDNSSENDESNLKTTTEALLLDKRVNDDDKERGTNENNAEEFHPTTIHFDVPTMKHDHLKKIELSGGDDEDGIKIKTTDKDSDTIFYISNTEVKVIESIPTASPNVSENKKYYPAIYEEDVILDVPNKSRASPAAASDKYEEDIVLSPLTSDFDPKDINYIGEAFLDVEESQNGNSENRHIIPLTSDVVIQPMQLRDMPSVGIPIIGELPPQIELEEMVFSDDYDSKQQTNFRVEEYYPNFLSNRLVKNQLEADVPREIIFDSKNGTLIFPPSSNRTHISINTMINGTNMTSLPNSFTNASAYVVETEEAAENSDLNDIQTLLVACFFTIMPLFVCFIIVLTIRYCWRKYHRQDSSGNDMMSDKSTDPLAEKNGASIDEMKTTDSGITLDRGGNMQASTELLLANGDATPTNHNGTNGSIITMTLKNNHLIVETEERNDISRDTRETKMHYSPSEKDGVFIVEAARGADQNGSHKPSPLQQKPAEAPLVIPEEIKIDTLQSHFTPSSPEEEHKQPKPEQVEVHTPPRDVEAKEEGVKKDPEPVICNGAKTGLSQSDLSLTSSNSSNQNYTYGDKESYQCEEKGYKGSSPKRIISVHCHDLKPLIENSPPAPVEDLNKPVITSAIFKNDSHDDREYLKSDSLAVEQNGDVPSKKDEDLDKAKIHKINGLIMKNGLDEIISVPDENFNDAYTKIDCNGDSNGFESLSYLPAPPEELSNDHNGILELTSMDSLPPPPPEMTELAQS